MQWCPTLFDLFSTGNFSSTQTTTNFYFNSFSTHTQGRSNCHFYSSFIIYTVFYLTCYCVSNYHSIQFRTSYLKNVDLNIIFTSQLLQLFFNSIHFSSTFTNDNTWFRSMNSNDQFT